MVSGVSKARDIQIYPGVCTKEMYPGSSEAILFKAHQGDARNAE